MDRIQRAFGPHDLSRVQAHLGPEASASASAMQASAFTMGEHVAFAGRPSLHTAAHEAAHVVQQRGGARPPGGVGRENDIYERQADNVADRVVAGRSVADLLGRYGQGGSGSPVTTLPPALSAVQMKRAWERDKDKAKSKWISWDRNYNRGIGIFGEIYQEIKSEGKTADSNNPEPRPEDATQGRLAKQAAGLYDWIKGLNSTAGGKIYELIVAQYHRKNNRKAELFLGRDDRTEPDITLDLGPGNKRAEEVKMVSVEDPYRVDEMVHDARDQLDNARSGMAAGYTQWKIRTHINDANNPWPGVTHPALDADFLTLVSKKLVAMKWMKQKDGGRNSLQISGINPPRDSGIDGTLTLEAIQSFVWSAALKTWFLAVDFIVVHEDGVRQDTKRYKLDWNSKERIIKTKPKLGKLSRAFGASSKGDLMSPSPMKR